MRWCENRDDCGLTVATHFPEDEVTLVTGKISVDFKFPGNAPPCNPSFGDVLEKGKCSIQIFVGLDWTELLEGVAVDLLQPS